MTAGPGGAACRSEACSSAYAVPGAIDGDAGKSMARLGDGRTERTTRANRRQGEGAQALDVENGPEKGLSALSRQPPASSRDAVSVSMRSAD